MSPIVNTEIKMSRPMLDALTVHETYCVVSNIDKVTHESVFEFLKQRFGENLANQFKPEYLY